MREQASRGYRRRCPCRSRRAGMPGKLLKLIQRRIKPQHLTQPRRPWGGKAEDEGVLALREGQLCGKRFGDACKETVAPQGATGRRVNHDIADLYGTARC